MTEPGGNHSLTCHRQRRTPYAKTYVQVAIGLGALPLIVAGCSELSRTIDRSPTSRAAVGAERTADQALVLRQALSERLGVDSVLQVDREKHLGSWTFVCGAPRTASDDPIDYTQTTLRMRAVEGMVDDRACALLQRTGSGLVVRELSVGDTDMGFIEWPPRYGISDDILAPD
jgi:hypothetical protein